MQTSTEMGRSRHVVIHDVIHDLNDNMAASVSIDCH